jgi:hypothetical protein
MALTINPAVSGSTGKFLRHASLFFLGVFGGALLALFAVLVAKELLSIVVSEETLWLLAVGIIGYAAARDLGLPLPLPYRQAQVPERFRELFPQAAVAVLFGMQLGVGVLTLFTFSPHVAMIVGVPFLETFNQMLAVLVLFSVGKTISLATSFGVSSPDEVTDRFRWSPKRMRVLRVVMAACSITVAIVGSTGV